MSTENTNLTNAPGNVAPTGTVTATEPQAQGASPALDPAIAQAIAAGIGQMKDSLFAELRRSGALGQKSKPQAPESGAQTQAAPSAQVNLRSLDRALMRAGVAQTLSESALQRMESAFTAEAPPDADAWVGDYLGGFGVARQAAQAATSGTAPAQLNKTPSSDGGSPPAARVSIESQDLLTMSPSDLDALIKTKGAKWVNDTFKQQIKGVKIQLR